MKTIITAKERSELRALLTQHGLNRILGSVDIGVSLPTLNNILSPSHKGDYGTFSATARKVRAWVSRMTGKPIVKDVGEQVADRARKRRTRSIS